MTHLRLRNTKHALSRNNGIASSFDYTMARGFCWFISLLTANFPYRREFNAYGADVLGALLFPCRFHSLLVFWSSRFLDWSVCWLTSARDGWFCHLLWEVAARCELNVRLPPLLLFDVRLIGRPSRPNCVSNDVTPAYRWAAEKVSQQDFVLWCVAVRCGEIWTCRKIYCSRMHWHASGARCAHDSSRSACHFRF